MPDENDWAWLRGWTRIAHPKERPDEKLIEDAQLECVKIAKSLVEDLSDGELTPKELRRRGASLEAAELALARLVRSHKSLSHWLLRWTTLVMILAGLVFFIGAVLSYRHSIDVKASLDLYTTAVNMELRAPSARPIDKDEPSSDLVILRPFEIPMEYIEIEALSEITGVIRDGSEAAIDSRELDGSEKTSVRLNSGERGKPLRVQRIELPGLAELSLSCSNGIVAMTFEPLEETKGPAKLVLYVPGNATGTLNTMFDEFSVKPLNDKADAIVAVTVTSPMTTKFSLEFRLEEGAALKPVSLGMNATTADNLQFMQGQNQNAPRRRESTILQGEISFLEVEHEPIVLRNQEGLFTPNKNGKLQSKGQLIDAYLVPGAPQQVVSDSPVIHMIWDGELTRPRVGNQPHERIITPKQIIELVGDRQSLTIITIACYSVLFVIWLLRRSMPDLSDLIV